MLKLTGRLKVIYTHFQIFADEKPAQSGSDLYPVTLSVGGRKDTGVHMH